VACLKALTSSLPALSEISDVMAVMEILVMGYMYQIKHKASKLYKGKDVNGGCLLKERKRKLLLDIFLSQLQVNFDHLLVANHDKLLLVAPAC